MRRQHRAKPRPLFFGGEQMVRRREACVCKTYLLAPVTSTVNVDFSFRSRVGTSMMEMIGIEELLMREEERR